MHSTSVPAAPPQIAVRRTQWDRHLTAAGLTTHTARGAALGIDRTLAMRLSTGDIPPSARVIAASLALLDRPFEDLFEVVVARSAA